jgi:hypothetical protein
LEENSGKMSSQNLHINRGLYSNKELQNDWKNAKPQNFAFNILSELEYKVEETVNYNEEVKVLREMVLEELNISQSILY